MPKKLKSLSKMDLLLSPIEQLNNINSGQPERKNALTYKQNKITVDTAIAYDTQMWETGIKLEEDWIIVEQYNNEKEAKKGHEKYVEKIKQGKKTFKDIDIFNLNGLNDDY